MDSVEVRMRCIEAAAKQQIPHKDGYAAGTLETARQYAAYVIGEAEDIPFGTML